MSSSPDVAVVIPTRNRRPYVVQAVQSALAQRGRTVEVHVVSDGSSDDTVAALASLHDNRLAVTSRTTSHGVAATRNEALERVSAPWVAFLDDDDLWAPTWLDAALTAATSVGARVAYGGIVELDRHRRAVGARYAANPDTVQDALRAGNALGGPSAVVMQTDLVRRAGGFDPDYSALADWELWLRLAPDTTFAAVPELLIGYTLHEGNMHMVAPRGVLEECERLQARYPGLEQVPILRWLGAEHVAAGQRMLGLRLLLRAAAASRRRQGIRRTLRETAGNVRRARQSRRPRPGPKWLETYAPVDC
jgi:glycosyltransferase involved in cell wall biosynthesis